MVFLLVLMLASVPNPGDNSLPQWMTPEESLHVDEIGKGHIVTVPPGGWVEMPGEFEPLHGVFISWYYWYGSGQDEIFREICREVVDVSRMFIIVSSSTQQNNISNYLTNSGVSLDSVDFMIFPFDTRWIRDYGPWFMRKDDNTEGIVDFIYNRPRPQDDTIPWRIGNSWSIPVYGSPVVHAGGNFMMDGLGTGFASDLIYDENPGYTAQEIDSFMLDYCGLEQFIVMQKMNIEYTGHIDLWTKILNDTLVLVGEYAPGHTNYALLNQNAALIASKKNREGENYRVARIPMPWSTSSAPPTYLNSLMVNNKVLVPLWGEPEDDTALFVYEQLLPDHEIVGIDCSYMAGSGGAIHCITMQAPSRRYIHVRHYPLPDSTNDTLNPYRVRAEIITSSGLITDSTLVFYKINSNPVFNVTPLSAVGDTPGVYAGYIPAQSFGDTVCYYLLAKNTEDIRRTSPFNVPPHIYAFLVGPGVSVAENDLRKLLCTFKAYPNPAHNNLIFSLSLQEVTGVRIEVYNVLGQRVKLLENAVYKPGKYLVEWNLRNDENRPLTQGVYFYKIITEQGEEQGKFLLIL